MSNTSISAADFEMDYFILFYFFIKMAYNL